MPQAYRIQIANKNFYDFLSSVGLMPNKSLILKEINIPKRYFADFLRGLIDGDGCTRQWAHPTNFVEQWTLRIYSSSRGFLVWLKNQIETLFKVRGKIYKDSRKRTSFILKYGKLAAKVILKNCYYKNIFSLGRRAELAHRCVKSREGWGKSKTVFVGECN